MHTFVTIHILIVNDSYFQVPNVIIQFIFLTFIITK